MIIIEENKFQNCIDAIVDKYHDCIIIRDSIYQGIDDKKIALLTLNPKRIILTADKDFGDLVFLHKIKLTGVILLRFQNPE